VDDAAATYEFAAVQTYDDGEVVAWDQAGNGDTEPERPAPTLSLDGSSADETVEHPEQETSSGSDPTARVLGGAGLALGVAGLGLALSGRGRRPDAG
jgi:hypothetical protein